MLLRIISGIVMKLYGDVYTQLTQIVSHELNENLSNRVYAISS